MNTQFDIEKVLSSGKLRNDLEYERALVADRKLRILCNQNTKLVPLRKNLRDLIERYEKQHWSSDTAISDSKIRESDLAELIAEKERQFVQKRKGLIKKRLKESGLNQQQLMSLLGHKSKTYMSELMNGISFLACRGILFRTFAMLHSCYIFTIRYIFNFLLPHNTPLYIS
jgi:hypothetical protein